MAHKVDLVTDLAKAFKIGKKVATGEMTLADVLFNRKVAEPASEGEAKCEKTPGCICANEHDGGCVIDVQTSE